MRNQDWKKIFYAIKKVDNKNIVLQYKSSNIFYRRYFYL